MRRDSGAGSKSKNDDLDAIRTIRKALEGFNNEERERIIRWACEPLGLAGRVPAAKQAPPPLASPSPASPAAQETSTPQKDIATFVRDKDPQTDIHLATTIAYYYRFEALPNARKDEIDAESLSEACRLAGRPGQLTKPLMTLNNAHARGLLDRVARGKFVINSVGENLVGMALPGDAQPPRGRKRGTAASKTKAPKAKK